MASKDVNSISSDCEDSCVCFYTVDLLAQRNSSGFSLWLSCKTETCWERVGWVLPELPLPGKMAEAAVPPVSLDLVGGKAAWLSHAGLSPTEAS